MIAIGQADNEVWVSALSDTDKLHALTVGRANQYGPPLGFKTIITPSKEAVQRHVAEMRTIIKKNRSASQDKLIRELNPVIRGEASA